MNLIYDVTAMVNDRTFVALSDMGAGIHQVAHTQNMVAISFPAGTLETSGNSSQTYEAKRYTYDVPRTGRTFIFEHLVSIHDESVLTLLTCSKCNADAEAYCGKCGAPVCLTHRYEEECPPCVFTRTHTYGIGQKEQRNLETLLSPVNSTQLSNTPHPHHEDSWTL